MKFERKAPIVEGVQWDGTIDGARKVIDLLRDKTQYNFGYIVKTEFLRGTPSSRIEFTRLGGYLPETTVVMIPQDWLVIDHCGKPDILPDDVLRRDYNQIEEDE